MSEESGMITGEAIKWPDGFVPPELPELTPEQLDDCAFGRLSVTSECLVERSDDVDPAERVYVGVPLPGRNESEAGIVLPDGYDFSGEVR